MSDVKAVELAKQELAEVIAAGEKLISLAGSARDTIEGSNLTDVMAWVARSGHIIQKVVARTARTIVLSKRRVQHLRSQ